MEHNASPIGWDLRRYLGPIECKSNPANNGCHCNNCITFWSDERCYSCFPEERREFIKEFVSRL